MKKYKIRKGSLAWIVTRPAVKTLFVFILYSIAIWGMLNLYMIRVENCMADAETMPMAQVIEEDTKDAETAEISLETASADYYTTYDVPLDREMQLYIIETAKAYEIPVEIVLGIIKVESNFNAGAVGDNGNSLGLMQIQPRWCKARMAKLGCDNLLDAKQNVLVGCDIYAELLNKYGDVETALICYNAGESGAKQLYFDKGIYSTNYSNAVITYAVTLI